MDFAQFKESFPSSKITEEQFPELLLQAEIVINGSIAYDYEELSEKGKELYNRALAVQINHFGINGVNEGNLSSQNINGVVTSFSVSGKNKVNISDLALSLIYPLRVKQRC